MFEAEDYDIWSLTYKTCTCDFAMLNPACLPILPDFRRLNTL